MQLQAAFKPYKPRQYTSVKAVISKTFAECGGVKEVAKRIGAKIKRAYKFTDPADNAEISFAAVAELTRGGATAPVEYLCALAGGHFVPGEPCAEPLEQLAARAAIECGEFTAAVLTQAQPSIKLALIDKGIRALARARARIAAQLND